MQSCQAVQVVVIHWKTFLCCHRKWIEGGVIVTKMGRYGYSSRLKHILQRYLLDRCRQKLSSHTSCCCRPFEDGSFVTIGGGSMVV
jgi:hypothetical protein